MKYNSSNMFAVILLLAIFGAGTSCCYAQTKPTRKDSLAIDYYFRQAFKAGIHSREHAQYLDSVLAINPRHAYAWQQKAMPLFKQKKYELGMSYLDSSVKYDRTYRWLEYRAFIKCIFQKSYKASIADFLLAEKRNPGGIVMDHSYDFYRGLCCLQLNKFDSCELLVQRSIAASAKRTGEGHFLEYLYLGISQMEQNNLEVAIESFNLALRYYPRFSDVKYYKALCLIKLNRTEDGLRLLTEAKQDLKSHYTINEDNVIYEAYPYQVEEGWIDSKIKGISGR